MYVSGRKVEFFSNRTASLNKSIIFVSIKVIPKDYNLLFIYVLLRSWFVRKEEREWEKRKEPSQEKR